jgi:hypothetical protein
MSGPRFSDFVDFLPVFHPKEMMELGVFCGNPFPKSGRGATAGLPGEWFATIERNNLFEASSEIWPYNAASKIQRERAFQIDPDGWFQWYCRFCAGRRIDGIDALQISMWRRVGSTLALIGHGKQSEKQTLLEWAHDPDMTAAAISSAAHSW